MAKYFIGADHAGIMTQVVYERKLAEDAVREVFSCEIAIHNKPFSLDNPYKLKTIKIHIGVLRNFFDKNQPMIWKIEESNIISDETSDIPVITVSNVVNKNNLSHILPAPVLTITCVLSCCITSVARDLFERREAILLILTVDLFILGSGEVIINSDCVTVLSVITKELILFIILISFFWL